VPFKVASIYIDPTQYLKLKTALPSIPSEKANAAQINTHHDFRLWLL
jgi:hypothetical protein